ncbi:MAG: hypothetical protein AAB410_03495 [Patescibacteria group bacterium]
MTRYNILEYGVFVFYPSTKKTMGLPVDGLVFWYGMFAPKGRSVGTTALAVGLHFKQNETKTEMKSQRIS